MRWVIVAQCDTGLVVIGPSRYRPGAPHTYPSSEVAGKDADAIESDYDQVHVLPIIGITGYE